MQTLRTSDASSTWRLSSIMLSKSFMCLDIPWVRSWVSRNKLCQIYFQTPMWNASFTLSGCIQLSEWIESHDYLLFPWFLQSSESKFWRELSNITDLYCNFKRHGMPLWPSGLRRETQVLFIFWWRGFEPHRRYLLTLYPTVFAWYSSTCMKNFWCHIFASSHHQIIPSSDM